MSVRKLECAIEINPLDLSVLKMPKVCSILNHKKINLIPFINFVFHPLVFETPAVTKKPFLVGDNECTWGPSHWCKDEETATKCGSMEFCKNNKIGQWRA